MEQSALNLDKNYNVNGGFKPTVKRRADLDGPDFYPTPFWATHALLENEVFPKNVWECACGNGAMSKVLKNNGYKVRSSDLFDRGYGESGINFLETKDKVDAVITNPPFHSAEGFVKAATEQVDKKFALLLRLAFLESANRARTIFSGNAPSRVWVFSERITFYPAGVKKAGSGTTAYAWFVWDKEHIGPTELNWFKPGFKKLQFDEDGKVASLLS